MEIFCTDSEVYILNKFIGKQPDLYKKKPSTALDLLQDAI